MASPKPSASPARGRRGSAINQQLMRRLHAWTSMISLVAMIFFGITGVLLNHASWTLGSAQSTVTTTGTLPETSLPESGIDYLAISEYIRSAEGVTGTVNGHGVSGTEGFINYLGPGYQANLRFDTTTRAYTLTVQRTGWVGTVNDIHRSKGTGNVWSWVNDLAGGLLVFIGVTGLAITLMTRSKNKRRDLILAGMGLIAVVVALWSTGR